MTFVVVAVTAFVTSFVSYFVGYQRGREDQRRIQYHRGHWLEQTQHKEIT